LIEKRLFHPEEALFSEIQIDVYRSGAGAPNTFPSGKGDRRVSGGG